MNIRGRNLQEADEQESIENCCAEYYRSKCRRNAKDARYRLLDWFVWMDVEIDNIRSVLQRCLKTGDVEGGLDLANSLGWYWITRATTEGAGWLEDLLEAGSSRQAGLEARSYFMRGFLAVLQADPTVARAALAQAVAVARTAGQPRVLSESLSNGLHRRGHGW